MLLFKNEVLEDYTAFVWADSHGVTNKSLGAAEDYIHFLTKFNPKRALVIGSGSGFIPYLILKNSKAEVVLVDALFGEMGNGAPMEFFGKKNDFYGKLKNYEERVVFLEALSADFFKVASQNSWYFDFIFIDGDHSIKGVTQDFRGALTVALNEAIILFHDTNMPWVRLIADNEFGLWKNIEKGCGTGIYFANNLEEKDTKNISLTDIKYNKENLKLMRDANLWSYLRSSVFLERFVVAEKQLVENLGSLNGLTLLEVGGNPKPFSAYLLARGHAIKVINVEPVISDAAREEFVHIYSRNGRVLSSLKEVEEEFDIFVFFGLDLSLSKDFSTFLDDFSLIHKAVKQAKIVVLEAPDHTPSRLLLKLISEQLDLIGLQDINVDLGHGDISVSSHILNRRIVVGRPNQQILRSRRLLEIIGRLYSLDEAPLHLPSVESGLLDVDEISAYWGYPKESSDSIQFTWLPDKISMVFSEPIHEINFSLKPSFAKSIIKRRYKINWLYTLSYSRYQLRIKLTLFGRLYFSYYKKTKFVVKLPWFVPNKKYSNSNDSRKLSYPVTKMEIT